MNHQQPYPQVAGEQLGIFAISKVFFSNMAARIPPPAIRRQTPIIQISRLFTKIADEVEAEAAVG